WPACSGVIIAPLRSASISRSWAAVRCSALPSSLRASRYCLSRSLNSFSKRSLLCLQPTGANARPRTTTRNESRHPACMFFLDLRYRLDRQAVEHVVDQAVFLGLDRGHEVVPIGVFFDFLKGLAGVPQHDFV